jgi:hypothetical protein
MAQVVIAQQENAKYSENLFPYASTLNDRPSITVTGGGTNAVIEYVSNIIYNRRNSIRAIFTGTGVATFNLGNSFDSTVINDGTYILSARIFVPESDSGAIIGGKLATFINSAGTDFEFSTTDVNFEFGKWNTFTQLIDMVAGDDFEVQIKIQTDTIGSRIYLGGFKLEQDDRNLGLPSRYSEPLDQITGFQTRIDTINTQALTSATQNTIAFSGTLESNGGLILTDSNAKITPITLNDVITVDFGCTFVTPAGSDHYATISLFVDGNAYRATTHQLIKGSGNDDEFSISWTLPVKDLFLLNGGIIKIKPDTNCSIKNRYLNVLRTHKGIN